MIGKKIFFNRYFYLVGSYPNDITTTDMLEGVVLDKVRLHKHPNAYPPQDYYLVSLGDGEAGVFTVIIVDPSNVKSMENVEIINEVL